MNVLMRGWWSGVMLSVVGASAFVLAGCEKPPARPAKPHPNVLVISVDTLRADKLGCYGNERGLTPRIDALAAQSMRFERAYAHAPWTLPSFASLLTSLTPPAHGAGGRMGKFRQLREDVRTVAECFQDAGYATASIVNVDFLTATFGMTQGFEHVDFETYPDNIHVRNAARTTDAATKWLRERPEKPFFMLVHYFDPHLVYAPPPAFRKRFADPRDQDRADWVFGTRAQVIAYRRGEMSFDDETIRRAEKLYDGEIAYTDEQIGRLLDSLHELGLAENTIVVFTADHGEEFLDHGGFEHGHTLYDELVHVPLMVRYPPEVPARTVANPVGLIDVAPTLCALANVDPEPGFSGENLIEVADEDDARPILTEGNFWGPSILGWVEGDYKLVVAGERTLLFNWRADPSERADLSTHEPERVARMRKDMELVRKVLRERGDDPAAAVDLPSEEAERLRSLGYLE